MIYVAEIQEDRPAAGESRVRVDFVMTQPGDERRLFHALLRAAADSPTDWDVNVVPGDPAYRTSFWGDGS